ncbi:hypothetical protein [Reichenbachiella ulvae]|uniref:Uncharacterized protein n=1 Tax=Reichenbachiella ulvae TaxID=2980104 RepID=A0ABT3CU30_9BACT|nr:hypothetical protein [Reichenbachiella ulvae]MCV9386985.1 hypothetical protein [Reichenbachiella ulvae]
MKTNIIALILFIIVSHNLVGQNLNQEIVIYKPDTILLETEIYEQLLSMRSNIDEKQSWNEVDMRTLAKSGSAGFPETYITKKLSKIGYNVEWRQSSLKSSEPPESTYGELTKKVEVYKDGALGVISYLTIFGTDGTIISEGEPEEAIKIMAKKGA